MDQGSSYFTSLLVFGGVSLSNLTIQYGVVVSF